MPAPGDVTHWIDRLKAGDPAAAWPLWQRYFRRVLGLARRRLRRRRPRAADAEDVALSAFDSLCRGAAAGRFPALDDRDSLWRLLTVLIARKASNLLRHEGRAKRGGQAVQVPGPADSGCGVTALEELLSREPTPEHAAQVAEECERLLTLLGDRELEGVACRKMEGYTNEEIAQQLDCSPRSVYRKLTIIRKLWEKELAP
jgi:RNA polymerase sigma factor (sigma-70 family)